MKQATRVRLTPQRRAVLETVRESREHPTAQEILQRAREKQPGLSYATVYNALDYLVRAGLVHE
ncbi:MAG: transcriptional repressor, partial [Armatimonadota bacterium]|nr:transcriptional repressor [Armatimonadota bacterium]